MFNINIRMYAGRYRNLQYGNYGTKVNITKTMIIAPAMRTIVSRAVADRPSWRNSRTTVGVSRDMSVVHLSRNRRGYCARCRHLPASAGIRHVTRIGRETSRGCSHIRVCRPRRL